MLQFTNNIRNEKDILSPTSNNVTSLKLKMLNFSIQNKDMKY